MCLLSHHNPLFAPDKLGNAHVAQYLQDDIDRLLAAEAEVDALIEQMGRLEGDREIVPRPYLLHHGAQVLIVVGEEPFGPAAAMAWRGGEL